MCGIVGYVGDREATAILLEGLKRLEYRGYDSAGIAVFSGSSMQVRRASGKLVNLEKLVGESPVGGRLGIGHTRWATHGRPTEINAHPHLAGPFAVVHNGIIENYSEIKSFLMDEGHEFTSETDTEVICHLIWYYFKKGMDTLSAMREATSKVRGSYALAVLNESEPSTIYTAKLGSPLVVGLGKGEGFVASDIPALLSYTRRIITMEDGEFAVVSNKTIEIFDDKKRMVKRNPQYITWNAGMSEKGGFKHYMLKEIFEQPLVLEEIISERITKDYEIKLPELDSFFDGSKPFFDEVVIVACGTSYHAGLIGKYWIESLAGVPVKVDYSSEFRYRTNLIGDKSLVIPISQSGETADTLAAMKLAKESGSKILGLCNVVGSSISRCSHKTIHLQAGPEIGVASTKVFTAQLLFLFLFALDLARREGKLSAQDLRDYAMDVYSLPRHLNQVLDGADFIKRLAIEYSSASQVLFIGRGYSFPIALEGALKLKEISYMHAEGFPAGELKHGPIALIDECVCVVAIAPRDHYSEKLFSNVEEVVARGASVLALVTKGDERLKGIADDAISVPHVKGELTPILTAVPLQLFAYYMADHKGTDVDQPRNLAKSVTVE